MADRPVLPKDAMETIARDLLEALTAVLDHVEDPDVNREGASRGWQCTLCRSYRWTARRAIDRAREILEPALDGVRWGRAHPEVAK